MDGGQPLSMTSYASHKTIKSALNIDMPIPNKGFKESKTFKVGSETVQVRFFGEGHTTDNVVAYVKSEETLFGGCLVKSLKAGKGNLADANTSEWSNTIRKIKKAYPELKVIIPGHGKAGDQKLLDYTEEMFSDY